MSQLFSLSKAARLAGVSRADIQNRIRQQGATTFEGKLTGELLQQLYPHVDLEAAPELDRVQKIKSNARPKSRYGDGWTPDPEMLMKRLKQFHRIVVESNSTLNASETLVEDVICELNHAVHASEEQLRMGVAHAILNLEQVLRQMRRAGNATTTQLTKTAPLKPVSSKVRILPSGHEFLLDGNDSILEAGLKAGFYLDYGCSGHNCGKCISRVVSGNVIKIQDHDYLLTTREKEQGYILACCHTADGDLILEAAEAGVADQLPYQEVRAVVRKIRLEGKTLALLEIQTPRSQSLRFKAGQQVRIVTEDEAAVDLYIASCPCDGRNLQFIVNHQPGDTFNDQVFNGSLSKQTVLLKGPTGDFLLHEESTAAAVFLASGPGFAPIKSLLEQAINTDTAGGLHLIQHNCYPIDSFLDKLCRAWNDSLENFLYTVTPESGDLKSLIELLAASIAGDSKVNIYVAGPSDWLTMLLDAARSAGLKAQDWRCLAID